MASGTLLGTERDLCERFGVTPTVLRQATRILESRDIVTMKRGTSGGIYVGQTSLETVAGYVATLWELEGVDLLALASAQALLRTMTFEAASRNMTLEEAYRLRELQKACRAASNPLARSKFAVQREDFIASLSHNPFLVLSHAISTRFIRNLVPFENLDLTGAEGSDRTDHWVEALVAGDAAEANRVADAYVVALLERLEAWKTDPLETDAEVFAASRPEWLSRTIIREIRERRLQTGAFLGTEPDLLRRFGVARGTWRQALRLLEEHPAVESRRGTGGGIYVTSPDGSRAEQMIAGWLEEQKASVHHLASIVGKICLLQIDRLCDSDNETLRLLDMPRGGCDLGKFLEAMRGLVSVQSGNPALAKLLAMFQAQAGCDEGRAVEQQDIERLKAHLASGDRPAAARAIRQILRNWF